MPDKPKIAICVSGQTRHFNADPQYTEDFNNVLGLFDDFEYDLFGHTWSDQENPHQEVLERFTDYRSDDQKVIWDTIIDLNLRKAVNDSMDVYMILENITDDENIISRAPSEGARSQKPRTMKVGFSYKF